MASSRGLVVEAENSRRRGLGLKPPLWRPFFKHHSFGTQIVEKLEPSIVACAVIPQWEGGL
jgi:hypothetical protein